MREKKLLSKGLTSLLIAVALMIAGSGNAQTFSQQKIMKISVSNLGYNFAAAIDESGNLWTWGNNSNYCLGTGTAVHQVSPFLVAGTKFKDVSCGYQHIIALDVNGNVWACGENNYGRLGDNATVDVYSFKQITTGTVYKTVGAGGYNSAAIDAAGNIWSWGRNNKYQVGNNAATTADVKVPTLLTVTNNSVAVEFVQISMGSQRMFAIDKAGNLWGWGDNANNGLGFVDPVPATTYYKVPTLLNFGGKLFKSVSAGDGFCMAVDTEGNIWSWGTNQYGQLGMGYYNWDAITTYIATKKTTDGKYVSVKAGQYTSFAIDNAGELYAWGDNSIGLLGLPTSSIHNSPDKLTFSYDVNSVSPGNNFNVLLGNNGRLYTWGKDNNGQLADGANAYGVADSTFKQFPLGASVSQVLVGGSHVGVITTTGDYITWGRNLEGQLGNSGFSNLQVSQTISANNKGYKQISSFNLHNIGLDANNQVWTWGYNRYGECGVDTTFTFEVNPRQITTKNNKGISITSFKSVNTGDYRSYVIDNLDRLWVFGQPTNGSLGTGTSTSVDTLYQVIATPDAGVTMVDKFKYATGGFTMSALIDLTGKIWVAGSQAYGQLGNGVVATSPNVTAFTPLNITENSVNVVFNTISVGTSHCLAIDNNGSVWAWGRNNNGQLGSGTLKGDSLPIKILDGAIKPFKSVLARGSYSYAIDTNNKLYGWGYSGSLGIGNITTNTLTPLAIMSDKTFKGIYGNGSVRVALETNGNIYLSGTNSYGELGNGLAWQATPKLINTDFVYAANNELKAVSDLKVYGIEGQIVINQRNTDLKEFTVYNLLGNVVAIGKLNNNMTNVSVQSGLYVVKTGEFATKVLVK